MSGILDGSSENALLTSISAILSTTTLKNAPSSEQKEVRMKGTGILVSFLSIPRSSTSKVVYKRLKLPAEENPPFFALLGNFYPCSTPTRNLISPIPLLIENLTLLSYAIL